MTLIRRIILSFLFLIFFINADQCKASHAFGAEMTYVSLDANNYIITYTLYRDCSGIFPASSVSITIENTCGFTPYTLNLPQVGSPINLPPICPQDSPSTCQGGVNIGVQKYVYQDTITLPGSCSNWTISHGESARSTSLTTITGAGSDVLFVFCMINNQFVSNNSPLFLNQPYLYVCLGTPFNINAGIVDNDGDSLTMQLITPLTSSGTVVTYYGSYSGYQPLVCNPLMTFNSVTGELSGLPIQSDYSVYAILVNKFRNGVLIGQVERDLSIIARSCPNANPAITGFDGSTNYSATVLPNVQTCFSINSSDADAGQSTLISLNTSMGGLSFMHFGGTIDSAVVCWTPAPADSLNNPNCFSLKVVDNACPFSAQVIRNFCLDVSMVNGVENLNDRMISIVPNPFQSELQVSSLPSGEKLIRIFDVFGKEVFSTQTSDTEYKMFSDKLTDGVYVITVHSNGNLIYRQKMIKSYSER